MASSGIYGRGLTAKDVASTLRESDDYIGSQSYWQYAEGQAESLYEGTENALQSSYNRAINEAYASSLRQREIMNNSRLVGQGRVAYEKGISDAYQQAYESYQQSLAEGRQTNEETYAENMANIQATLQERAENFAAFGESHYDYLKYLYDTYYEIGSGPWQDDVWRNEFLTTTTNAEEEGAVPILDANGKPVLDENGNPLYQRLRTRGELYNASTDESGIYRSIYDEQGYLTDYGKMYFDMIENYSYGGDTKSYGEWLKETDEDLYKFAYEDTNVYDMSSDGTNAGSFRELTGRTADDYKYDIAEHLFALSEGTIKGYFEKYTKQIDELSTISNSENLGKAFLSSAPDMISDLKSLASELGIATELDQYLSENGTSFSQLENYYESLKSVFRSKGQLTGDYFSTSVPYYTTGGLGAAAISAVPVFGPFLAAGVAILGLGIGTAEGATAVAKGQKNNRKLVTDLSNAYKATVDNMLDFALQYRKSTMK